MMNRLLPSLEVSEVRYYVSHVEMNTHSLCLTFTHTTYTCIYISSYAHTLSPTSYTHTHRYTHTHTLFLSHTGTYREPQSSTSLTNPSALEPEGGGGGGEGGEGVGEEIDPTQDEMERERLMAKAEQVLYV